MDNKDPDIIGKQASVISILSVIVLVLMVVIFFFGYCEPRHEKMNEHKGMPPGGQDAPAATSETQAATEADAAGKADSSRSK